MTRWAERAKAAIAQQGGTAKTDESIPPKLLAVSSVPTKNIPLSEKRVSSVLTVSVPADVEKNNSISAIKEDPDRWCWPYSSAMNGEEIGTFETRLHKFTEKGLARKDGEVLADQFPPQCGFFRKPSDHKSEASFWRPLFCRISVAPCQAASFPGSFTIAFR